MHFQTLESIELLPCLYRFFYLKNKSNEISGVLDNHEFAILGLFPCKADLILEKQE